MLFIETHKDFMKPEYLDEIVSKRYKDTPFAIVKECIGRMWAVYIILDDEHVVGYGNYYTKASAVKEIESGDIQKSINKRFETLTIIKNFFDSIKES